MTTKQQIDDEDDKAPRKLITVPLYMMDAVQREVAASAPGLIRDAVGRPAGNRPGFLMLDDERRAVDQSREEYQKWLANAWKNPNATGNGPLPAPSATAAPATTKPQAADADPRIAAYAEYNRNLQDAWRARA